MTNLKKYFDNNLAECEKIMDWATSDERSDSEAWDIHKSIITSNFQKEGMSGDWCWSQAIELWEPNDICDAIEDWEEK